LKGLGAGASFCMRFAQEGGFLVPGYLCFPWSGCGCVLLYAFRTGRGFPCPWLSLSSLVWVRVRPSVCVSHRKGVSLSLASFITVVRVRHSAMRFAQEWGFLVHTHCALFGFPGEVYCFGPSPSLSPSLGSNSP
jgi:hypothetical protein